MLIEIAMLVLNLSLLLLVSARYEDKSFPVAIRVYAARPVGEMKPIWSYFGADEPNYATMKNGRKLLAELGKLSPHPAHFRTHNLLTSGDGTPALKWGSANAYTLLAQNTLRYVCHSVRCSALKLR